jgi:BirA family biotin operon repressor/biotin-[acetyl-CoA-carboxylase] ligase
LYLTVRIPWTRPVVQAPVVSMGTALAAAFLARELGCPDIVLKWPNDLLLSGAKAAGLLAEMATTGDGPSLMVGIGLNVSTAPEVLEAVGQPATSLSLACGQDLHEDDVLARFLALWTEIDQRIERGGFAAVADDYRAFSDLEGRAFRLATAGTDELVRFVRVNDDGSLAVRRADGSLFATFGGELLKA